MDFSTVAQIVADTPNMTPANARRVYDHLVATDSRKVLELGTAHGVSACYMAAALEASNGLVTTVDHVVATRLRDPQPAEVIDRVGLGANIDRVLVEDSSYAWWLKDQIAANTDSKGQCQPVYDFVYIDGAHNWTIDGLAFFLVEKLMRPGGWLLLDDLLWAYVAPSSSFGPGQGPDSLGLSDAERATPHMQLVFDLLVRQHPSFSNFRIDDGDWGWAQKLDGGRKTVKHVSTVGWKRRARRLARLSGR